MIKKTNPPADPTGAAAANPPPGGTAGPAEPGMWRRQKINPPPLLPEGAGTAARDRLYALRPTMGLVLGASDADVKAAGTYGTQVTEVRYDAIETVKRDYPDLARVDRMSLEGVKARRIAITETETVDSGLSTVRKDVKATLAFRHQDLLDEFSQLMAEMGGLREATLATDNPDQRIMACWDILNGAATEAARKALQGKKDKQNASDDLSAQVQALMEQVAHLTQSNQMLQDQLAQERQKNLLSGTPAAKPAKTPKQPTAPKGKRKNPR